MEPLEDQGPRGPSVPQGPKEQWVIVVQQVRVVWLAAQVLQVLLATQGPRGPTGRLEHQVRLGLLANRETPDHRVSLVRTDKRDSLALQDKLELAVSPDPRDQMETQETLDRKDRVVSLVPQGKQGPLVLQAHLDLKALQDHSDSQDLQDLPDQWVRWDSLVDQESKAPLETRAHPVL